MASVRGVRTRLDDHDVAVEDAVADHRVADHAERERLAAPEQIFRQRDGLRDLDRLDRPSGRDATEERNRRGAARLGPSDHLQRAALMRAPADGPPAFEAGEVLVHRGQGRDPEVAADLLERRGNTRVASDTPPGSPAPAAAVASPRFTLIGKEKTNLKMFLP